jgi:8-oxo-(d)GTP phosphatase
MAAAAESTVSILVRHASAGDRHDWAGDDRLRPLDDKGRRQAEEIAAVLDSGDVRRVVSSPYVRCVQTVEPLAAELGLEVELDDRLAEGAGAAARPLLDEEGVVLCTHGDVLHELLGRGLKKAEYVVLSS